RASTFSAGDGLLSSVNRTASLLPTRGSVLAFALASALLLLSPVVPWIYLVVALFDAVLLALVVLDFLGAPGARDIALERDVEPAGPLRLARRAFVVPAIEAVKVYPNPLGVDRMKLFARRRQLSLLGMHRIRKRGTGGEFEKLRPYAPGDEFRRINWKATLR